MSVKFDEQEWRQKAACSAPSIPIEYFFSTSSRKSRMAIVVCRQCPVQQECFNYAVKNREQHGIWGGFDAKDIPEEIRKRYNEKRRERARAKRVGAA